jgi:Cof subfamily protein (haloacid dehalogenase superfamily)
MSKISLVVSDVDGTLVTTDKVLTERSRAAVASLGAVGIGFSVISSRPPFGLRMLIEPLRLRLPIGAFNGAAMVTPDLSLINRRELPAAVVKNAIARLHSLSIDVWLFTADRWLVENPRGPYVDKEIKTIETQPTIVDDPLAEAGAVSKLVGVSEDFARLAACEPVMRNTLGNGASVVRSQRYYLDVTPADTSKGAALAELARRAGVPTDEIVTLGDMDNDVSMFRNSGFSIAMGNASDEVKHAASAVTLSNDQDGFAEAIERIVLPRAQGATGAA